MSPTLAFPEVPGSLPEVTPEVKKLLQLFKAHRGPFEIAGMPQEAEEGPGDYQIFPEVSRKFPGSFPEVNLTLSTRGPAPGGSSDPMGIPNGVTFGSTNPKLAFRKFPEVCRKLLRKGYLFQLLVGFFFIGSYVYV